MHPGAYAFQVICVLQTVKRRLSKIQIPKQDCKKKTVIKLLIWKKEATYNPF